MICGDMLMCAPGISKSAADKRYLSKNAVYGVRWDYANDLMQSGILIADYFFEHDYEIYPIQEQMVRGLLTSSGDFTLLNANDSTYLEDGDTLATLDGSAGQVMVRIPKFYALCLKVGDYRYVLISQGPFEFQGQAAYVPPAFGADAYRYIGAFQGVALTDSVSADLVSAVIDTSGYSMSSPNPFTSRTRAQFRAQMQDGFFQYSWGLYEILWMLFLTEYKTWDSQTSLPGYTGASSYAYSYSRPAGRTLSLGNASGSILADLTGDDADLSGIVDATEYVANSYRGIENPFGNVWQYIDGINIDNTDGDCNIYVCHDPDNFADDTTENYIDTGIAPGFGDVDDWIRDMAFAGQDCTFYPVEIGNGASSSVAICDYLSNSAGGWRVLLAGGHMTTGAIAGLGGLTALRASSGSAAYFSARSAA